MGIGAKSVGAKSKLLREHRELQYHISTLQFEKLAEENMKKLAEAEIAEIEFQYDFIDASLK